MHTRAACKERDMTPWFTHYRWAYLRAIGAAPFEQFEAPVACACRPPAFPPRLLLTNA